MAVDSGIEELKASFTVRCGTHTDLVDRDDNVTLLTKGKSYSQTFSIKETATKDQIKAVIDAVMSLSVGVSEQAHGNYVEGEVSISKKIMSKYLLILE